MRYLNSVHFGNMGYLDGWDIALDIASGGVILLDWALKDWYAEIRQRKGAGYLLGVRLYSEGGWEDGQSRHWNQVAPTVWAAECVRRLGAIPGLLDDPYVCISLANEQDLACEGHPGGASEGRNYVLPAVFDEIWTWQYEATMELRNRLPQAKIKYGTAPLAGGHEPPGSPPDSEYQLASFKRLASVVDCLWDHAYCLPDGTGSNPGNGGYWHGIRSLRPVGWESPNDLGGLAAQYPGMTIIRSEFGNFRHHDAAFVPQTMQQYHDVYKACSESGQYALIAPFIFNSGDEHWQNRIKPNTALVDALRTMYDYPAAAWPPVKQEEPMAEDPRIQQLLDQNAIITQALIDFRHGRFEGAEGMDGKIVALNGGKLPDGWNPSYPPKA